MTGGKNPKSKGSPDINELKRDLEVDDHTLSIDDVVHRYQTHADKGLTSEKAAALYALYGPNQLTPPPQKSELRKLFDQLTGGFSLMLIGGAILCYIAYGINVASAGVENTALDNVYLGTVLIIVVHLTGLFGFYQEHQSSSIMNSFKDLVPQNAVVVRDGAKTSIPATQVVLGDLIVVKAGDRIPADIRIVECNMFKVDNSSLTGEAEPQVRGPEFSHENPLETRNLAFFSTSAVEGTATGIAIKTGDGTVMGRIAYLATGLAPEVTPLHRELSHFVHIITAIAITFGGIFLILALAQGYNFLVVFVFVIGIIVANVPEGLLATVTVALSLTAKRMAQKNCLVKHLEAVETLGSTSTICSDKTGTLTQNRMTVAHLWFDNIIYEADTTEDQSGAAFDRSSPTFQLVWRVAALCNRAEFLSGQEHKPILRRDCTGDASESALLKFIELTIGNINSIREKYPKRFEIPFNSVVKFQISIHECDFDDGTVRQLLVMKGAPERIFERCKWIMVNGTKEQLDANWSENFERAYVTLGGYGERVLGFCFQELDPQKHPIGKKFEALLAADHSQDVANFEADNLTFAGLISLVDPPRAAVPDAVRKCRMAGIRVIMVTGDHPITAKAIAHQVGIISEGSKTIDELADERQCEQREVPIGDAKAAVVSGTQLKAMKNEELDAVLQNHAEIVFARTSPQQKLNIVEACQRLGHIVAVTGDGVNDSPALKKADIGVAMGIAGSDVTKNVADMILLDDNFASIVVGVEEGRKIFNNLKKTIAYILTSNIPELVPFLLYIVVSIPLPLGVITCLFIDIGTDLWPAVALAYEPAEADIMHRKPRDAKRDRLVTDKLVLSAYFCFGVMEAFAGLFVYFCMLEEQGWRFEKIFGLRSDWENRGINDLQDSYGTEWTFNQRKDLEQMLQSSFFCTIVVMQWANLISVKTQRVSIFSHGMGNWPLNFGFVFETTLAFLICYFFPFQKALNTRNFFVWYWVYAMPWSLAHFFLDEAKKLWIRRHPGGKVERETCY